MAALNKIGDFEFLSLVGNPEALKRKVEMHSRAGVDGVTLTRCGKFGTKITLQSRVDAANRDAARALYRQYLNLIGADPVTLLWWQIQSSAESWKAAVLDVRQVAARRLVVASGGLNSPGLGFLICDWDIVAIAY